VQSATLFRETSLLTQLAFDRLLEWLDDGRDTHGQGYLEMRQRLVRYFARRNRPAADDLADETLNRVGRTLAQEGRIAVRPPARYCYLVARFVLLEDVRRAPKEARFVTASATRASCAGCRSAAKSDDTGEIRERRLTRLESCLQRLTPEQRELIVEYYRDARGNRIEHRRELAGRLGISMNALAIRVSRIRGVLVACLAALGAGA
jgi:DNA-directed RNA polymerase specialized sigma24 family protein